MIIYDKFGDTSHIDGKGLTYTYTNDGRLATRTNARGIMDYNIIHFSWTTPKTFCS